jgi:hypothetical protein
MSGNAREDRKILFKHNDYVGLAEWADDNWNPKPEYARHGNNIKIAI